MRLVMMQHFMDTRSILGQHLLLLSRYILLLSEMQHGRKERRIMQLVLQVIAVGTISTRPRGLKPPGPEARDWQRQEQIMRQPALAALAVINLMQMELNILPR